MKQQLDLNDTLTKIVQALDEKKAQDIRVIKVERLTTLTEYFVICNGTNSTQIKTLADNVEVKIKDDIDILHREGYNSGNWVLLDYGCIIVHVFHKDVREVYDLEKLWSDGEQIDISTFLKA
ncbi:MAG: ribosome silencing factor [Clostridia bacterium]